jgi:aspartyl/asparaginyl beta-hydroxylase (cupin superfamily)
LSPKIWFSFFDRSIYKGSEPAYSNISEIENLQILEDNFEHIKNEFLTFISKQNKFTSYFNKTTVSKTTSWKTISLLYWNKPYIENHKNLPALSNLIKKIPGCVSCSLSLLESNSQIKPHCGDTNAIWRCHLPLIVPGTLPDAGLKVAGKSISWQEGKIVAFCDAHEHEAWNDTSKPRYIIILDIIKPEYRKKTNHICSVVLSSITLQKIAEKINWLYKIPIFIQFIGFINVYLTFRIKSIIISKLS